MSEKRTDSVAHRPSLSEVAGGIYFVLVRGPHHSWSTSRCLGRPIPTSRITIISGWSTVGCRGGSDLFGAQKMLADHGTRESPAELRLQSLGGSELKCEVRLSVQSPLAIRAWIWTRYYAPCFLSREFSAKRSCSLEKQETNSSRQGCFSTTPSPAFFREKGPASPVDVCPVRSEDVSTRAPRVPVNSCVRVGSRRSSRSVRDCQW